MVEIIAASPLTPNERSEMQLKRASKMPLQRLSKLDLSYPGWEEDVEKALAKEPYSDDQFEIICRIMQEKQHMYAEYRSIDRLSQLAKLKLSYPGFEEDAQAVEEWNLKHGDTPDDDTSVLFREKLDGLKNKQRMFDGDRTHPHIVDLDALKLSYSGWEDDYHLAIKAHCESPISLFPDCIHTMREKQKASEGVRLHWRLDELDKMQLTYPGWESDVKEVEAWHFRTAESRIANTMFAEVLEGMRDQEQVYLGWDFAISSTSEDYPETDSEDATISSLSNVSAKHYKLKDESEQIFESISDSLAQHEERRKGLMEQRLAKQPMQNHPANRAITSGANGPGIGQCVMCQSRVATHVFVPCGT
jgi:hypothetical protein